MFEHTPNEYEQKLKESIKRSSPDGARWFDQKVTYDNFFVIANTVNLAIQSDETWFNRQDIQKSHFLEQQMKREYGKPATSDVMAANEYDKFISQNLNVLACAGILNSEKKRSRMYSIADRELLQSICATDNAARAFLIAYLEAKLKSYNWWSFFERYKNNPNDETFTNLKSSFTSLLMETMNLGSRGSSRPEIESGRIFAKVINPLAFQYGVNGAEHGRMMKSIPSKLDLSYNQVNFRDEYTGKLKNQTRKQFESENEEKFKQQKAQPSLTKQMAEVRKHHNLISEFPTDERVKASHVHHIFPRSRYPQFANVRENMICLTPGQHLGQAHPNGNTSIIDPIFQRNCLFHKLTSIAESERNGDDFYSFEKFGKILAELFDLETVPTDYESCRDAISQNS